MFTSRTCVRSRARAARARRSTCMQDGARAREVTLHLTLCFWFYSHKAFWGANIFFCRRFEWREVSISVWQYFSCCSLLPPPTFRPPPLKFSVFSESELMGSHGCLGAHAAQTPPFWRWTPGLKKHQHGDVVFEFSEISQLKLFKTLEWLKADNHHL